MTDGKRVVAVFGSAGVLVAWDFNGKELWRVDLGALDSGWFFDPAFQWGHSSSPIIYRNAVILQADVQKGSYIAAWDLATGKQLWKTARADEISTWGTPTLARTADGRDEIVTNGTKIRGYDPATGKQLWTLGPNSEITIGTPVAGNGLVYVTGGYPPVRPIYAIRPGAEGDISLQKGQESNQAIAWSNMNEGTYIPTPLCLRRVPLHPQHQRHRLGVQTRDRSARVPWTRRHRRIVLCLADRRGRTSVYCERRRRGLRDHRCAGLDAGREERHEGSDHGDAGDLGWHDRRANAGSPLRHRTVAVSSFRRE